jgi:hypothetical protein
MFGKGKDKEKKDQEDEQEDEENTATAVKLNRIFYIVPHTGFTKTITVLDLTGQVKAEYPSEEFEKETKQLATKSPPQPFLNITRTPRWYSKNFVVEKGSEKGQIAQWKGGMFSTSSNTLTFPPDSPHSSHPITIEAENNWKFREQFVKDSVIYQWKPDNALTARKFTMFKIIGDQKQAVGRYLEEWSMKYGGTLALNSDEIDEVVAVLSIVNILRKKRQKAAERSGGGGGGGG